MRINSLKEDRKPLLMIIPMIDIIFFLLVFFMMSMLTMVTQKTIALNLPKAAIAKVDTTKTVPVSITEDGRLFLEQNLVSEEELARRLVSLKWCCAAMKKPISARWLALWMSSAAQALNESP